MPSLCTHTIRRIENASMSNPLASPKRLQAKQRKEKTKQTHSPRPRRQAIQGFRLARTHAPNHRSRETGIQRPPFQNATTSWPSKTRALFRQVCLNRSKKKDIRPTTNHILPFSLPLAYHAPPPTPPPPLARPLHRRRNARRHRRQQLAKLGPCEKASFPTDLLLQPRLGR